jgi:predicted TPR repeat methyltransferase
MHMAAATGVRCVAIFSARAARGWWERAVAADPRLASAWYRLGNAYERAGDPARARQAWGEFLRHAGAKLPREQREVEMKLGGASPVAR